MKKKRWQRRVSKQIGREERESKERKTEEK